MIRKAKPKDSEPLSRLRRCLWDSASVEEHLRDLKTFFSGHAREPLEIILAEDGEGEIVAFCELSIRAYAESCSSDRVGYLEGWYVAPSARRTGIGRALLQAAEAWARAQGCTEFGSDAEVENHVSAAAHEALGFQEVGIIRCFRKDL